MAQRKRALVSGAGGFVGHHLVEKLKGLDYWVRGVDRRKGVVDLGAPPRIYSFTTWYTRYSTALGSTRPCDTATMELSQV